MAGSRLNDLKSAAADLVDIIVQTNQTRSIQGRHRLLRHGRQCRSYADKVRGTVSNGTCSSPGCQYYQFTSMYGFWRTFGISTCVSERIRGRRLHRQGAVISAARTQLRQPEQSVLDQRHPTIVLGQDRPEERDFPPRRLRLQRWPGRRRLGLVSSVAELRLSLAGRERRVLHQEKLIKAAVLMTDGEYNSVYCNGVISQDSTSAPAITTTTSTARRRTATPTPRPRRCAPP